MKYLVLVTMLFVSKFSFSQNSDLKTWVYAGKSQDGNNIYYKNFGTDQYGRTKIWIQEQGFITYFPTKTGPSKKMEGKSMVLFIFDCRKGQYAIAGSHRYNKAGHIVKSYTIKDFDLEFEDTIPGSIAEDIQQEICDSY